MRRGLTSTLLLTAVSAVLAGSAFAAASNSILLPAFVEAFFNGGFAPTELPAHKRAPVSLALTERIRNQDGSHPAALQEMEVELDRHLAFSVKGLPRCPAPLHSRQSRTETLTQCEKAKVGSGTLVVDVALPEEPAVQISGHLSIYNGGVREGRTTFWLYTYLPAPVAGTILAPLIFRHETNGPFGSSGVLTMPKIADGYASVTYLGFRFRKGVFAVSCPTGKSPGRTVTHLIDGTTLIGAYTQTCRASDASATPSGGRPAFASEGNTRMAFNAGIAPQTLPGNRRAPAVLALATKISTLDGSRPKALRRLLLETDSHLALDLKHLPACRYSQILGLEANPDRCSSAIVGNGEIYFEGGPSERSPAIDNGTLLVFNGGVIRGNRRLWLRYATPGPAEGTVVDPLEVQRFRSGPYRSLWALSIKQPAGGGVSLGSLSLRLQRGISATCPTGKSRFAATGEFSDGSRLIAHAAARCTPG